MTDAEQRLWQRLRRKQINGWQFYRQKPIGAYIVDFYCPTAMLVVEVDGGQHLDPQHLAADRRRDTFLENLGLRVLRFDNRQILLETEAVVAAIAGIPPGPPLPKGGTDIPPQTPAAANKAVLLLPKDESKHNQTGVPAAANKSFPSLLRGVEQSAFRPNRLQTPTNPSPPLAKGGQGGLPPPPKPRARKRHDLPLHVRPAPCHSRVRHYCSSYDAALEAPLCIPAYVPWKIINWSCLNT